MSERMSPDMSERLSANMSERMSEDMPARMPRRVKSMDKVQGKRCMVQVLFADLGSGIVG